MSLPHTYTSLLRSQILEIEYRKATAGTKIKCRLCGRSFYPEKLRVHRKYFCGESAQRTEAQSKTQRSKASNTASSSTSAKGGKRQRVAAESDDDEDEEDESSDEDSIAKQKQANKASAKKPSTTKGKPPSKALAKKKLQLSSDDDELPPEKPLKKAPANTVSSSSSVVAKKPVRSAAKRPLVKLPNDDDDDDDDDEEDYEPSSSSSSIDSDSDEDDDDVVVAPKRSSSSSKGKTPVKPTPKKPTKAPLKDDDDDKEEDEDSDDDSGSDFSDVERDIAAALKKAAKVKQVTSLLHMISWFRVVLDEAHVIKDRSTSTAKAVFNLVSMYKWCLTGTPLQNRVGELYSLVRFLRIDPHAYYYCKTKGCTCKSLHYRFTKGRCDDCNHSAMTHFCHFNKHILNPIKRCGYIGEGRTAMLKLKEQVLDEILLR